MATNITDTDSFKRWKEKINAAFTAIVETDDERLTNNRHVSLTGIAAITTLVDDVQFPVQVGVEENKKITWENIKTSLLSGLETGSIPFFESGNLIGDEYLVWNNTKNMLTLTNGFLIKSGGTVYRVSIVSGSLHVEEET